METILLIIFSIFFFWLVWKRTDLGIAVIIILLPSYLVRFEILGIPATLLELMILLLFLAWLTKKQFFLKAEKTVFSQFWWLTLLFLLSAVLAIFISPDLRAALGIFKAYFLEPLLFFLVLINTIRSSQQTKLILGAIGISALFVSIIALWQYLNLLPSYEPWISEFPKRVSSIFEYPNAVGLFLAPIAVLFLGILLLAHPVDNFKNKKLKSKTRHFILGVIIFSLLAIIFSFSRGAILGILAGVIFFSFFSRYKKWIWAILALGIALALIIPQSRTLIYEIVTFQDVSSDVRTVLWQGTWNLLKDRPLQGAGLAGFPTIYDQYRLIKHTELLLYPHNIIFNFWTELGLAGLIIFIWLIVKFFSQGIKFKKVRLTLNSSFSFSLPLVLLGTMIAVLVYGLVDVPYFKNDLSVFFWLLIGLLVVVERIRKSEVLTIELAKEEKETEKKVDK
ncbi:MAG: hypothetical protein COT24_04960 [Candidatus Kerfeldbacteria bacterium CG08_land_8_20_14_0_20_40_16]|uniref:O-antigen ligase-related domain-containing protein n=1 Tax=Candidatus Kerfeldbacteria bacterium CG08_land_8_20_14_0_20_40_16 TaxID=2014244 RepID=A0A2H0YUG3_9BACT|nr:MAG: hypothetical protein COT24_04960 [Candidatus Kerfeldbacteria bacterium CG08_land_8_20_14_0_20_40_16]